MDQKPDGEGRKGRGDDNEHQPSNSKAGGVYGRMFGHFEEFVGALMSRWGLRRSLLPGYLLGFMVLAGTFMRASEIAPGWNVALTRTIAAFAGILGWIAGIMSLPENKWQENQFNRGWAAISTFAGGALVSHVLGTYGDVSKWQPNHWARVLLAATWFAVGLLFTGAARLEGKHDRKKDVSAHEHEKPTAKN